MKSRGKQKDPYGSFSLMAARAALFLDQFAHFHKVFALLTGRNATQGAGGSCCFVWRLCMKTELAGFDKLAAHLHAAGEPAQKTVKAFAFATFCFNNGHRGSKSGNAGSMGKVSECVNLPFSFRPKACVFPRTSREKPPPSFPRNWVGRTGAKFKGQRVRGLNDQRAKAQSSLFG